MDIILTILVIVVVFGLLVFIHEFGHFWVAKKVGVVVEQFAFGFGPKIISKTWHGTEYRINSIPLGGYVKMLGDQDGSSFARFNKKDYPAEDRDFVLKLLREEKLDPAHTPYHKIISFLTKKKEEYQSQFEEKIDNYIAYDLIPNHPGNYDNQPARERVAIVVAGVIMNFLLGIVMFYVLFIFTNYRINLPKIGNPPIIGAETTSEFPIIYDLYNEELSGYETSIILEANGEVIESNDQFESVLVDNYDKSINLELFLLTEARQVEVDLVLNGEGVKSSLDSDVINRVVFTDVGADTPAEYAGFEAGDVILTFDGVEIISGEQLIDYRDEARGTEVEVVYFDTDGAIQSTTLAIPDPDGEDPKIGAGLGEYDYAYFNDLVLFDYSDNKLMSGTYHAVNTATVNLFGLGELVKESFQEKSLAPVSQGVGSIVAVTDFAYSLVKLSDFTSILNLAASLSIILAIMNILPIPLLDGGHLLFITIEKLRGRPLSERTQETVAKISFTILILLTFLIMGKDIIQFEWPSRILDFIKRIF